jgi:cysteine-rich repeat protein
MHRYGVRWLIVSAFVTLAATRATAAVDMNGGWNVSAAGFVECQLSVVQVGTALTMTVASCPVVGAFSIPGTIDVTTGVFSASGTSGNCATSFTVSGTTNATSTAFTASYTCNGNPGFAPIDGSRCGNGVLDAGEACDDGNRQNGDCCSSTCTYEAAGGKCTSDGNDCTFDVCDGAGVCTHATATGLRCTDDGNPCTDDVCDAGAVCQHVPNTKPCDDGDPCTLDDTCSGGACTSTVCSPCCDASAGCTAALGVGCKETTVPSGPLQYDILSSSPASKLTWKWKHGEAVSLAELGDPTVSTDYALCVYRHDQFGTLRLVTQGAAPGGGMCGTRACWHALGGKGFKYNDRSGHDGGLSQIVVFSGANGLAKLGVKSKGQSLTYKVSFGPMPVEAELRASNGTCFRAGFSVAKPNEELLVGDGIDGAIFKARASSPSGAFVE